jgi:hypothetical protein
MNIDSVNGFVSGIVSAMWWRKLLGFFCSYSSFWKQAFITKIYVIGKPMESKAVNVCTRFIQDFNNTMFTEVGRTC